MGSSFGGQAYSFSLQQKGEIQWVKLWEDSLCFTNIIQVKARKNKKDNTEKNFAPKVTCNSIFVQGKCVIIPNSSIL